MLKRDIAIILGCIASIGVPIGAHAKSQGMIRFITCEKPSVRKRQRGNTSASTGSNANVTYESVWLTLGGDWSRE